MPIVPAVLHLDAKHLHFYAAGITYAQRRVTMVETVALGIVQRVPVVVVGYPAGETALIYWWR